MQYTKRPDVVEAEQWFEGDRPPRGATLGSSNSQDPHIQGKAYVIAPDGSPRCLNSGDFVIVHADGHVDVMPEALFKATYTKYRG